MLEHHVREEEKRGGMFSAARKSGMDLDVIDLKLAERVRDFANPDARGGDE